MTSKLCPRCKQKDNTDFSTCRFCGFKYGAALPKSKTGMGFKIGYWPLMFCLFIAAYEFQTPVINAVGFIATGGKQKNVVQDSLINFAATTEGQDPQKYKSILSGMQSAMESDKPMDEAFVRNFAEYSHKNVGETRTELLRYRTEYRHKHHLN